MARASAWALASIVAVTGAAGQKGDQLLTGWHIVREGETLNYIAEDYLGSKQRWPEIWRLNPELKDPDVLRPGERIRVHLAPDASVPSARLTSLSGRVEDKPNPLPWEAARELDVLVERDGIRTFEESSTEMSFTDGTSVVLTEESLVFVRRDERFGSGRRRARSERRSVEVVEGQADVETVPEQPESIQVEVLVAGATLRPRQEEGGGSQTRARKSDAGGAELMVYAGSSEVEAGGQKVPVAAGMGTAVPQGAPPNPPENLLPAPVLRAPADGAELPVPNPRLEWDGVEGAVSYTVEFCHDPECKKLLRRALGVKASELQSAPLPVQKVYWRVTPVSASGLDGYPSGAASLVVLADRLDTEPPTGRVTVAGRHLELDGRTLYDNDARVEVAVEDAITGVAAWELRIDGEPAAKERLAGDWGTGRHTVEVVAVDRAGNRGELPPLTFEVDADPPEIEWGVHWVRPFLRYVRPGTATRRWLRQKRAWALWSYNKQARVPGGRPFLVMAWGSEEAPIADSYDPDLFRRDRERGVREFEVRGNHPRILLLAAGVEPPGTPPSGPLDDGRFVSLSASDEASGVVEGLWVRREGNSLAIESEDPLGNRVRMSWPWR